MLTPEEIAQILDRHRKDAAQVEQHRLNAIKELPDTLRPTAYALLDRDEQGSRTRPYNQQQDSAAQAKIEQALWRLDALEPAQRQQLMAILFPRISHYVDMAWEFSKQLPYQSGYRRRAFRAPAQPAASFWKRLRWLRELARQTAVYEEDLSWFAQYSPLAGLGIVFAAVIDSDDPSGQEIFDILVASAKGEHEAGRMGRHIPRALLSASRQDGWEFIERLLLAAQREEGLRQTILETVDEAHPEAFRRMLRLILDHNLARFSSVTRAMNVWLGFGWDSENTRTVNRIMATVLEMLESTAARQQAIREGDGEAAFLALWAAAFEDAYQAIPLAAELLRDNPVERRFAGLYLLASLNLPEASAAMLPVLEDEDLRLVAYASQHFQYAQLPADTDLFEKVEQVLTRMPDKPSIGAPILWDWIQIEISQEMAAGLLLKALGCRSAKRLIPYMYLFNPHDRVYAARHLASLGMDDQEVRDVLLKLVGDRNQWVRESVVRIMAKHNIHADDAPYLEGLLTRKANDLRRGILQLLARQNEADVLASADRLMAAKKPLQRAAGLELLQLLTEEARVQPEARQRAAAWRAAHPDLSETEAALIQRILQEDKREITLEDALGLMNPAERTPAVPPAKHKVPLITSAAVKCLESLDELIHEHRSDALMLNTWQGTQEILLANANHLFPFPDATRPLEEDIQILPLRDLWQQWDKTRPAALRDADGLELLRAWIIVLHQNKNTHQPAEEHASLLNQMVTLFTGKLGALKQKTEVQLRYRFLVQRLMPWLVRLYEPAGGADFLLDVLEATFASVSDDLIRQTTEQQAPYNHWRANRGSPAGHRLQIVRQYRAFSHEWTGAHHARLYRLLRWLDEPVAGAVRQRPQLDEVLHAYDAGAATLADLYDQLLGARPDRYGGDFRDLYLLSSKKPHPLLAQYPALQDIFEACRQRILEVELRRGELPTAAAVPAMALRSVYGIGWFIRILQALGRDSLTRGYAYNSQSRSVVFSHLLRVSFPAENETRDQFAEAVRKAKLSQKQLVEAAIYAPQWASYTEHALGWEGFSGAVWWIHAHTKDRNWYVDAEVRETWMSQVSEGTPLTGEDLLAGAVDVQWFWQVYHLLGDERWSVIYDAAKYSSGGGGHTRAKLFADAMLGRVEREAIISRIIQKRHQDAVRALGLLPLPAQDRDAEILTRYQIMQEFVRTSRKFGSQRQESEKLAARIGLENLARTAGYPDPLRLQWAMEAQQAADLRDGPVIVTIDDTTVTLRIDEVGKAHLDIHNKAGKKLKTVPARLRKAKAFVELRERKKDIDKQHARMRQALEAAMCREDSFSSGELRDLLLHPVLAPMLEQLVFVADELSDAAGYLVDAGRSLMGHDGTRRPIEDGVMLRIAHPCDLYRTGEWSQWQHECFVTERIQPFKQVFRELYVLTEAEKLDGAISRRYAGHQVQPRQALALLGSRGWVIRPEEGVQRTFHKQKLVAFVTFLQGFYTPAEVEGLTIEGVVFVEPGRWKPLPLEEIPPVLFSEVMRDLDLVVSVAHRGGVDPETTASTVEMRTALIRETCAVLKLKNVELRGNHALIEGDLGSYSVHLGSASVHRQPGGALCIIPVHAQHRGRLFLPFADDDPKTAEVISKVLLLARDAQIRDPTILEQIYASR